MAVKVADLAVRIEADTHGLGRRPQGGDAAETERTITRESPFAALMEVYEDGAKLLDVYSLTWFPENGEWLVRQASTEDLNDQAWRFRNSTEIRLTATLPEHWRLEARIEARRRLQDLYGWIPAFEVL